MESRCERAQTVVEVHLFLFLRLAMKNEFSPKTIGVYLMEKTILGTDLA